MKRKTKRMIGSILLGLMILTILFVPVKHMYRDGGTVTYNALTYKVVRWGPFVEVEGLAGQTRVYLIPQNFMDITELEELEKELYEAKNNAE